MRAVESEQVPPGDADADTRAMFRQIIVSLDNILTRLAGTHKDFYTIAEIAALTGRSQYTVRRWVTEKRVTATRVAGSGPKGRLLIARDQVSALVYSGLGEAVPAAAFPAQPEPRPTTRRQ
jgi:excisionase family DNA binding protein